MAGVTFREAALVDLDRHDTWRASLEPPAPPVAEEIVVAVLGKLLTYERFDEVPYTSVTIRGESLPVKRMLVQVRSKTFIIFLAEGPDGGIEVARVQHPSQRPLP